MARNKGTFQFAANFEVKAAEALDPRIVVTTKSELINKETWPSDGDTLYLYEGLLVSVADEGKIYMLTNVTDALSADYSAWKEIGAAETIDIIDNLESDRTDAALSAAQGKSLKAAIDAIECPEYNIVKLESPTEGHSVSYQLQKNGEGIGAIIDIPKDLVVSSGSIKEVTETNIPYVGAEIGDLYIELLLANAESDAICIPVNKLVDKYQGSEYIDVNGVTISLNYDTLLSKLTADIGIQTITKRIDDLESQYSELSKSVESNISNVTTLFAELDKKADKTVIQNIESQITTINEINSNQAESISNLTTNFESIKVKDVDTTVSNGIGLTLSAEGIVGVNANLQTSDIVLSEAVGTSESNTSLQAALVSLSNRITSAVSGGLTSITSGNGLVVSEVSDNSQNISLKIKKDSNIAVDSDGLYLTWIEI